MSSRVTVGSQSIAGGYLSLFIAPSARTSSLLASSFRALNLSARPLHKPFIAPNRIAADAGGWVEQDAVR